MARLASKIAPKRSQMASNFSGQDLRSVRVQFSMTTRSIEKILITVSMFLSHLRRDISKNIRTELAGAPYSATGYQRKS